MEGKVNIRLSNLCVLIAPAYVEWTNRQTNRLIPHMLFLFTSYLDGGVSKVYIGVAGKSVYYLDLTCECVFRRVYFMVEI